MPSSTAWMAALITSSCPISMPPVTARRASIVELRQFDDANGERRVMLAVRSDLDIDRQITAPGATWLDRQNIAREPVALSEGGFGAEVRHAMDGAPTIWSSRASPTAWPARHLQPQPDREAAQPRAGGAGRKARRRDRPALQSRRQRRICRRFLPPALHARLRPLRHDRRRPRLPARALDALSRKAARPPCLRRRPRRRRHRLEFWAQTGPRPLILSRRTFATKRNCRMSATKILWGEILVVFSIVLVCVWGATEWTAWRLAFQPELGPPGSSCSGLPVYYAARLLLVVVSSTTPMRRRSSSKAPASPRPAASPHRRGDRHVGLAGARGQEGRPPMARRAGPNAAEVTRRRPARPRRRGARPLRATTICATTGRSMCCASRRPAPARASGSSFRRC